MHQVGNQPRLYHDARSTSHEDSTDVSRMLHVRNFVRFEYDKSVKEEFLFWEKHFLGRAASSDIF